MCKVMDSLICDNGQVILYNRHCLVRQVKVNFKGPINVFTFAVFQKSVLQKILQKRLYMYNVHDFSSSMQQNNALARDAKPR